MLANGLYTSQATVWPFVSVDDFSGAKTYGTPFILLTNWKVDNKLMKDANGREFTSNYIYYTADGSANEKDYIGQGDQTATASPFDASAEEIQSIKVHDCSYFNEPNDYWLIT